MCCGEECEIDNALVEAENCVGAKWTVDSAVD